MESWYLPLFYDSCLYHTHNPLYFEKQFFNYAAQAGLELQIFLSPSHVLGS
jgi:hypothetical protein